ncbi:MAG TPA: twin-arginine translocase TatA/TatE family subunit [Candidatus Dormibacteraeota bacterium]|nr:twin-arginine translocase TatA/TatE family subunit [Candidatus Dormibacteraeota bacterium]
MPFHPLWLVVILVVVLIIFGPGRLPELGSGLGRAMREFRKATSEITNDVTNAVKADPAPSSTDTTKSSTSETKPTGN